MVRIVTGEWLAKTAAKDFETFFLPGQKIDVRIDITSINFPCIRTNSAGSRIIIPREMAADRIEDAANFFFHLLMVSHEIAHLVHKHTLAGRQENADHMALEYWADFYGAKVMMTLVTHGGGVSELFREFYPGESVFDEALTSIGDAVGRLVTNVYADNARYPSKLLRVALTCNGISSFLRHLYASISQTTGRTATAKWYLQVFNRVFSAPSVRELMLLSPESAAFDPEPIERSRAWHREMQGEGVAITPGFWPDFLVYLHTSFDQTDEERAMSEAMRVAEFRQAGLID